MKKNNKGVTLLECLVAVTIVGVLAVAWGYYGRQDIKLASMNEGRAFVEKLVAQEKMYMSEQGEFIDTRTSPSGEPKVVSELQALFINTNMNKYYKTFKINKGPDILVIEMYPDVEKYPDFEGFLVKAVYKTLTDKIEYNDTYGN